MPKDVRLMPKKSKALALVPASARRPATTIPVAPLQIPHRIREGIKEFEQQIGGRRALIEALSSADAAEDIAEILTILADPKYDTVSLAKLCAQAGISPGQLFGAFKKAALVRGQILGSLEAAKLVPTVVREIGKTCVPYDEPCERCNGAGYIESGEEKVSARACTACNGVGSIHHAGDHEQQRTILELTGLIQKGSGVAVNVQTNNLLPQQGSVGGSLEQLQQAVSELIYTRPQNPSPVEAEVLPSPPDATPDG